MKKSIGYKTVFPIVFGLFLIPAWFSSAWGRHANIACTTCHDKTAEELKDYVHDSSEFPISARSLGCHDGSIDVSGLHPPHVINGQKELE